MFRTLKGRFVFSITIFIMLSVGIPYYFLISQFRANFHQRSVEMLNTSLDIMHFALNNEMMRGFQKDVQHIVYQISQKKNIEHIRIFDRTGLIRQSSTPDEIGKYLQVISPRHIEIGLDGIPKRKIALNENNGFYVAFEPIFNEPNCMPCHGKEDVIGFIDVDTELTHAETSFYTGSTHFLFLSISTTVILIIGLYLIFNFNINKPINKFLVAVDNVERGDLNYRMEAEKLNEFGTLERHFNKMVSELKSSREKIEEFHFEQLRHADRLATLGEMTAQVAHEINNHIGIVMSRADYLQLESSTHQQLDKYAGDIDVILKQIEKISMITKNILRHSKKPSKEFTNISLKLAVEDALIVFDPILHKRDIKITKILDVAGDTIFGDKNQVEQVIVNLINNSIDAIEKVGEIKIELFNEENFVNLSIKDNGCGISDEQMDQVFSPFYSTKPAEKGTGLGLYIIRNILKNHKAEISLQSEVGKGTEFILKFPKPDIL